MRVPIRDVPGEGGQLSNYDALGAEGQTPPQS